ncbi:unnamed protein product [Paramecium pentaurelia]|uniref:K Homology domain-containing protein n=1 Tax=Paramecium pentaurelia TaxID=43138 RepID=A0A8S1X0G3_9CILI|nr:unnamed protein product [Paramecium pentaurelia]
MDQDQRGLSPQTSKSSSHQNQVSRSKEFQLDFFIQKKFISEDLKSILEEAQQKYLIKSIHINYKNQIPELDGVAFTIDDSGENKMNAKCDAALYIIQLLQERCKQQINIILLIPEGIVSFLIGSKGSQLAKIIEETNAKITVNQPIVNYSPRTVKIVGDQSTINCAIRAITKKMQERGISSEDYKKVPETLNPQKVNVKTKLIFQSSVVDYIMKNKNEIENKYEVQIKAKESNEIKLTQKCKLKREDKIVQLQGSLSNVQDALSSLIRRVSEHLKKQELEIKIVMPASYASKLIGAKGCQIRELATKSKGAQIKVLSDKDETDHDYYCIVQIAGNLQNKQDASKLILQQIECFKNGGPIMDSGKFLNEDNQNQTSQQSNNYEDYKIKRQKSSSQSERNSRSRSQSRRKHKHQRKRSNERRSASSSYSKRRERANVLSTKMIISNEVMHILERYNKLREYKERFNVDTQAEDSRRNSESYLRLKGKLKDCLIVIEEILNEQQKILRK